MNAAFPDANLGDRGGGVKLNLETGHMEIMDDQSSESNRFTIFSNNQREMVPINIIVG